MFLLSVGTSQASDQVYSMTRLDILAWGGGLEAFDSIKKPVMFHSLTICAKACAVLKL